MTENETSLDITLSIHGWPGELSPEPRESPPDERRDRLDLTYQEVSVGERGVCWRVPVWLALAVLVFMILSLAAPGTAFAQDGQDEPATEVDTEAELRAAWADPLETSITLTADVFLRQCRTGDPIRESDRPLRLDGGGHAIRQTCFEKRVLRQDGTGYLLIMDVALTRGGSDGPGAALTGRGEIEIVGSKIQQNLSEESGGGVFSMRRITVRDSVITNNLANDDGGGLYARRGGVQVFDSVVSNNLVDGSGGAIGSTGDILLVRSNSGVSYGSCHRPQSKFTL